MHPLSRFLIDRSPRVLRTPTTLTLRTIDGAVQHRLPGLAAEIAFWAVLSLPALILTVAAAVGLVAGADGNWQQELTARIVEVSRVVLTERTIDNLVRPALTRLLGEGRVSVLSVAFLTTLWVASRAVRVVLTAITLAYGIPDERPYWQQRLLGLALTVGAMIAAFVLGPLLVAGPAFGETLAAWLGADPWLAGIWSAAYWPATILAAMLAVAALYHVGVPWKTPWRRDLPGAILATTVWLLGSAGLRLYGAIVTEQGGAYGPLAGPIVALLWLWVTGFAVLLGAELNAQIERRWPSPQRVEAAPAHSREREPRPDETGPVPG